MTIMYVDKHLLLVECFAKFKFGGFIFWKYAQLCRLHIVSIWNHFDFIPKN